VFDQYGNSIDNHEVAEPAAQRPVGGGIGIKHLLLFGREHPENGESPGPWYPVNERPKNVRFNRIEKVGASKIANATGFQNSMNLSDELLR